jgi:hypothetical protein
MKHRLPLLVALSLAVSSAFAAGDDVTMQVLDDDRDVNAVMRALRDARPAAVPEDDEEKSKRGRARAPAESQYTERDTQMQANDSLTAHLDREEESEGEIEDFDIPEDLEIPESEEDAEDEEE